MRGLAIKRTMSNPTTPITTPITTPHSISTIQNFPIFYEDWLATKQSFLYHLDKDYDDHKQLQLIEQVLAHYQSYNDEISKAAAEDVFRVFSAPWLSSYEKSLLWISGFKPSLVFRLAEASVTELTPEQAQRVDDLRLEVRRRERDLSEAMAALQEAVAAPPIVRLARRAARLVDGEITEMERAMEELKMGMLGVFDCANLLRGSTMKRMMDILRTAQKVKLLAAAMEYQLRIRRWGMQRTTTSIHFPL